MPDQDPPGGGYRVGAKVTLLVDKVWALVKWGDPNHGKHERF